MLTVNKRQYSRLAQAQVDNFATRLVAHWREHHASLISAFAAEELSAIAGRVTERYLSSPGDSEASIVLCADILLFEAAQRRRGNR